VDRHHLDAAEHERPAIRTTTAAGCAALLSRRLEDVRKHVAQAGDGLGVG